MRLLGSPNTRLPLRPLFAQRRPATQPVFSNFGPWPSLQQGRRSPFRFFLGSNSTALHVIAPITAPPDLRAHPQLRHLALGHATPHAEPTLASCVSKPVTPRLSKKKSALRAFSHYLIAHTRRCFPFHGLRFLLVPRFCRQSPSASLAIPFSRRLILLRSCPTLSSITLS